MVTRVVALDQCPSAIATTVNVFNPSTFVDPNDDRHARPDAAYNGHALVGTEDGTVHVFDVGGRHDDGPASAAAIKEVSSITVGKNPTSIVPLGASLHEFDAPLDYIVVSRGDRRIDFLRGNEKPAALTPWKTLRDSRLVDPIHAYDVTLFGNPVPLVEVSDYAGKQLVAYRYDQASLVFYGNRTIGVGSDHAPPGAACKQQDEYEEPWQRVARRGTERDRASSARRG